MSDNVFLRNNAKCNIIVPAMGTDIQGLVSPGEAIEVPLETAKCDFIKNLIRVGDMSIMDDADLLEEEEEEEEGNE